MKVKGPITFSKGKLPGTLIETIGGIKLPFEATNLKISNKELIGKKFRFQDGKELSVDNKVASLTARSVSE